MQLSEERHRLSQDALALRRLRMHPRRRHRFARIRGRGVAVARRRRRHNVVRLLVVVVVVLVLLVVAPIFNGAPLPQQISDASTVVGHCLTVGDELHERFGRTRRHGHGYERQRPLRRVLLSPLAARALPTVVAAPPQRR